MTAQVHSLADHKALTCECGSVNFALLMSDGIECNGCGKRHPFEWREYDAPRCPAGQFAFTYRHPELGTLECHMEGERGDPDSGQRDTATLYSAYLRGVDIADRLTRDEVEAIELAAVKAPREIEEPA